MDLGLHIAVHARKKSFLRHTVRLSTKPLSTNPPHTGRPLGTQEFVHALEEAIDRRLVPQKGGRPAKPRPDTRQSDLDFRL
jgi:hypothetical protein